MSTTKTPRKYKYADVVMLTSLATIVENAIINKAEIIAKRANWADPFLQNLLERIDTVIETYLGIDGAKALRKATKTVEDIQANALDKLGFFKLQVEQDFKKTPAQVKDILNELGFTTFYKDASQNKSQDALIDLLFQFKQNATADLITQLTSKGISATMIAEIIDFATNLKTANISQETFKSTRPSITKEAIAVFNDLYDDVIALGKISARIFNGNKAVQESFSYTKLGKLQQATLKEKKAANPTPPKP